MAVEQQVTFFGGPLDGTDRMSNDMVDTLEFTKDLLLRHVAPIAEDNMDQTRAYRHVYHRLEDTPEFYYQGWV